MPPNEAQLKFISAANMDRQKLQQACTVIFSGGSLDQRAADLKALGASWVPSVTLTDLDAKTLLTNYFDTTIANERQTLLNEIAKDPAKWDTIRSVTKKGGTRAEAVERMHTTVKAWIPTITREQVDWFYGLYAGTAPFSLSVDDISQDMAT